LTRALRREGRKEEDDLVSVYFDTPKHKLARYGFSVRVRHIGDKRIQTIKSEESNGSYRRGEWEEEISGTGEAEVGSGRHWTCSAALVAGRPEIS